MKPVFFIFLLLFLLPAAFADTCNPKPVITSVTMSSTAIALTDDPWSNKIGVVVGWELNGTTNCTTPAVTMKSDLENIYFTEKKYDTAALNETYVTNMDMLFLPTAAPGDDYLQVFVNCDRTGCNSTGDTEDAFMLLFHITPLKCTSNDNCSADQYCKISTKECLELNCEKCDSIVDHKCISPCDDSDVCTVDFCGKDGVCGHNFTANCCYVDSDCDDSLFCTKDSCVNNRCQNTQTVCEASGSCKIGVCVEPDGCRVYDKEGCDPAKEQQAKERSFSQKLESFKGPSLPKDKNTLVLMILGLLILVKVLFFR